MAYNLPDGRQAVDVTTSKTLVAADAGVVQNVIADGVTLTLPSTVAGLTFILRNGGAAGAGPVGAGAAGSAAVTLAPQSADGVTGDGIATPTVNKGIQQLKPTGLLVNVAAQAVGDYVEVQGSGVAGTGAWVVTQAQGPWTRVA